MDVRHDGAAAAPSPERVLPEGAAIRFDDGALRLSLATSVYPIEAILRSCYWLTDRCFFYVAPSGEALTEVTLLAKTGKTSDTDQLAWDFLANVVDQCLRVQINAETRVVRELIVAQAFAPVDIIDDRGQPKRQDESAIESSDPRGVQNWRTVS